MNPQFRIDLSISMQTRPPYLSPNLNHHYYLSATDVEECLEKTAGLIDGILKTLYQTGCYTASVQKIYICRTDTQSIPVYEIGYWQLGNVHLPNYNKEGFLQYFNTVVKIYEPLIAQKKITRSDMIPVFGTYNPELNPPIKLRREQELAKFELDTILETSMEPELEAYKPLLQVVYYTQLPPSLAAKLTKENIVNRCLVVQPQSGPEKIIPLHPMLEELLTHHWNPELYTASAPEEYDAWFAKLMEHSGKEMLYSDDQFEYVYPTWHDIMNSSFTYMHTANLSREDILLLRGDVLKSPDDYGTYEKILDSLFNSRFFAKQFE